jgi:hypothetical protein
MNNIKIENLPVIISCYSQSNNDSSVLSMNVEQLYNYGHPICIASHKLINQDLESKIDYFIYTKENYKLPKQFGTDYYYFHQSDNFRYQTNFGGEMGAYSYAILLNIMNGLNLLKSKGFKFFIFAESDTVIDYVSYNKILEYLKEFNFNYHNSWFMTEEKDSLVSSSLFIGSIDFFLNRLINFNTIEKYISYCDSNNISYGLEPFLTKTLYNGNERCLINNNKISDIIKNDFLGCLYAGQMVLKDFKTYNWWLDIVRDENSDSIFLIIAPSAYVDDITLEIYYDNQLKGSTNKTVGGYYIFEVVTDLNFNEISYVAKKNGNIIKKLTRSKEDIFNNKKAYAKLF